MFKFLNKKTNFEDEVKEFVIDYFNHKNLDPRIKEITIEEIDTGYKVFVHCSFLSMVIGKGGDTAKQLGARMSLAFDTTIIIEAVLYAKKNFKI